MKYFLLVSLIIFISCQSQRDHIYVIDPSKFSEEKFVLSDIADSIQYIPLNNKVPIGLVYSIKTSNDYFYLSTKDEGIIQFDWNGTFIKTIAKKGRAPGEYHYGMSFAVNEENGNIYIADNKSIKEYSQKGIFLRKISTENYISDVAGDIECIGSNLFIFEYGTYGDFNYKWIVLDSLGNLISSNKSFEQPTNWIIRGNITKFDNKLFYYNVLNDTIFAISGNLKYNAVYLFSNGEFRFPKEGIKFNSSSQYAGLFKPISIIESKHFTLIPYSYKDKYSFLLIDKKTKKTFQAYDEKKEGLVNYVARISNNIDGGCSLSPEPIIYYFQKNNSEYIVTLKTPLELKSQMKSDDLKYTTPKYPKKKKELEKLANSLDINDNPVLMLVKLKE